MLKFYPLINNKFGPNQISFVLFPYEKLVKKHIVYMYLRIMYKKKVLYITKFFCIILVIISTRQDRFQISFVLFPYESILFTYIFTK
jgi:hypothetical protein